MKNSDDDSLIYSKKRGDRKTSSFIEFNFLLTKEKKRKAYFNQVEINFYLGKEICEVLIKKIAQLIKFLERFHYKLNYILTLLMPCKFEKTLNIGNIKVLEKVLSTTEKKILQITDNISSYYRLDFQQKKLSNKIRIIKKPLSELKRIQGILNKQLIKLPISNNVHGWVSGRDPLSCTEKHINKKFKYVFDIYNFFDEFHNSVVNKFFLKNKCSYYVAKLLTRLTTKDNSLPQGAPTSQTLANLLFKPADNSITAYCKKRKAQYDRHGDDIVISSQRPLEDIYYALIKILRKHGFKLNLEKVKATTNKEIEMLGLIIGKKVSRTRKERNIIRSILFNASKTGLDKQNKINHENFRNHLEGKIAYIGRLHLKERKKMEKQLTNIRD